MSEEATETQTQTAPVVEETPVNVVQEGPVDSVRRAAIAVMVLGQDTARKIFRHLKPRDIETILTRAETLGEIEAEEIVATLESLIDEVHRTSSVSPLMVTRCTASRQTPWAMIGWQPSSGPTRVGRLSSSSALPRKIRRPSQSS